MTTHTTDTAIRYRAMTEHDLPAAQALSQAVKWPHRLEDWQFAHRFGGGFVAEHGGAVIGTALCWKFGAAHASLGMIIVSNDFQGRGVGRELMTLVLRELDGRTTLLNATPAGQPLYERLGFVAGDALHQHQGIMLDAPDEAAGAGMCLRQATPADTGKLAALASRSLGMPRAALVEQLTGIGEAVVLEKDGEPVGFSIIRRFGRGYVIGPVVAPDSAGARAVIAHWAGAYAGAFVRVDVTAASGLSAWLPELGLAQVDKAVSMVRGEALATDAGVIQFAVVNQALC
jgi:predicted N-acetyltransferase YhbS